MAVDYHILICSCSRLFHRYHKGRKYIFLTSAIPYHKQLVSGFSLISYLIV